MENVKVTEEQAKTLKLFAYYAQGYGKKEVNTSIYTQECQEDWRDEEWFGDGYTRVESYDAIDSVIDEIIEEHDLFKKSVTYCENRGQLLINIDCVERTLLIDASEWRYGTNESRDVLELSDLEGDNEDLVKIFNYMKSEGYSEGVVTFKGGGDSGDGPPVRPSVRLVPLQQAGHCDAGLVAEPAGRLLHGHSRQAAQRPGVGAGRGGGGGGGHLAGAYHLRAREHGFHWPEGLPRDRGGRLRQPARGDRGRR
jgi:hypothetical protein